MQPVVAGKEDAHIVAGVQPSGPFFRFEKVYFWVGWFKQLCQVFCHGAVKLAAMLLAKGFCIGEPGQDVAQNTYWEFEQYFFAVQVKVVGKDHFIFFVYFDTKIDKILFAAGNQNAAGRCIVDSKTGFAVNKPNPVLALGHGDAGAVVKVEADTWDAAWLLHLACIEGHIGFWCCLRCLSLLGQAAVVTITVAFGRVCHFFVTG